MILKVGITGYSGFIGYHLSTRLKQFPNKYALIKFDKIFFQDSHTSLLDNFVSKCDVIFHLAAINRCDNQQELYDVNINLTKKLLDSAKRTNSLPYFVFSSSTQENKKNSYGKSKLFARDLFKKWSKINNSSFAGLIIPNVFGPFSKPFHNSVVSTFSHQLINNLKPNIIEDKSVNLIYINNLIDIFIDVIDNKPNNHSLEIKHTKSVKVSEILKTLNLFKNTYYTNQNIPRLSSTFLLNLFNTFRSYIDHKNFFPREYKSNLDNRGNFVELMRSDIGGQSSFSTTNKKITRGNHFHTRKIERFSVLKGKAIIELRKIGTDEVISFKLNGKRPSFVDMPVFYTHNITNIGDETLYTAFWINEPYNANDPDTYYLKV